MKFKIIILIFCILAAIGAVSASSDNMTSDGNFCELNDLISNSSDSEINIEKNYTYDNDSDSDLKRGIVVNRSLVINGNGHVIDGKNKSMIFHICADNVVIKNITFMNANGNQRVYSNINGSGVTIDPYFDDVHMSLSGYNDFDAVGYCSGTFYDTSFLGMGSSFCGGAIYASGNNLRIVNSSFINNYASLGGGIFISGQNCLLADLEFINNTAKVGGAVYNSGNNITILKSRFALNSAVHVGSAICSYGEIAILNCSLSDDQRIIFCGGMMKNIPKWQIDNITYDYFKTFVRFAKIDFEYNLTHINDDTYRLKITFKNYPLELYRISGEDLKGFVADKKFLLNVDGQIYELECDSNSQTSLELKLADGSHLIKAYNPLTNIGVEKTLNIESPAVSKIIKSSPKFTAKNRVFSKKTKVKKYSVILKNHNGSPIDNTAITLKIKGKIFKAKTNSKGKATFKIKKLTKKGTYKAIIKYGGSKYYQAKSVKVKIRVK